MDYLTNLIRSFAPGGGASDEDQEPEECQEYVGQDAQICAQCGLSNPPAQPLCGSCRGPLAYLTRPMEDSGGLVMVPDFYQPLFRACHSVATGQITADQWSTEWESLVERLEGIAQSVEQQGARLPADTPYRGRIFELIGFVLSGVEAALQGMDTMALYLESGSPECLNRGWMELVAATGEIQKAAAELARYRPD